MLAETLQETLHPYMRIIMAISANENRFQEAMARPEILVQLRDLAERYPDITVSLTEGECWEVWGDMEHHERWQYGACHGWNRMPLTMIEPSYLLGWAYGRRSEAPPALLYDVGPAELGPVIDHLPPQ